MSKILTRDSSGFYHVKPDASPERVQYMLEDINGRLENADHLSELFVIELYLLRVEAEAFLAGACGK